MTIVVADPTDEPFGCLHPSFRGKELRDGGSYWPTVTRYLIGQRVTSPEDRAALRGAPDDAAAEEMVSTMKLDPDWRAKLETTLRVGLRTYFQADLASRRVLLSTGAENLDIQLRDARLRPLFSRILEETRSFIRARAEDRGALQCGHEDGEEWGRACEHLLFYREAPPRGRRFTGEGLDYDILCHECCEAAPESLSLWKVCGSCVGDLLHGGAYLPDVGEPKYLQRTTSLRFQHREVVLSGIEAQEVLVATSIAACPSEWVLLSRDGTLMWADFERQTTKFVLRVCEGDVDLSEPLSLIVAPDGSFAAVLERRARRGVVVDAAAGQISLRLLRDDYQVCHQDFPLAFFVLEGRLLMIHATNWDRLDVTDPRSGELLTPRESPIHRAGEPPPEHDLDYFHAGLHPSPGGEHLADNGWTWAPWGHVRTFSLPRFVKENVWESEDGPSVKVLGGRGYYWDGPLAWLDERTLAVWGLGDDAPLTRGVIVYDVVTGEEIRRFPGPGEGLCFFAPYLVAFDEQVGTTVWDPTTGELLARDRGLCPVSHSAASQELLTITPVGFRLSRLVGDP